MHTSFEGDPGRPGLPPSPPPVVRRRGDASSDELLELAERERPVRPSVVRRVGSALEAGTYDPPLELVVERLLRAVVSTRHLRG